MKREASSQIKNHRTKENESLLIEMWVGRALDNGENKLLTYI